MRFVRLFGLFLVVMALALPSIAQPKPKKEKDKKPGIPTEYVITKDGKAHGKFTLKITKAASGNLFTVSELETKEKGGTKVQIFHLEVAPDQTLVKYRKWIGKSSAQAHVITWWDKGKLRLKASKPKKLQKSYKVDAKQILVPLDRGAYALYAYVTQVWKKNPLTTLPALLVPTGVLGSMNLTLVGTATVKTAAAEELSVQRVKLEADGFALELLIGERPIFVGVLSNKIVTLPKGWSLVAIQDGTEEPADPEDPEDPEATDPEDPEDPEATPPDPKVDPKIDPKSDPKVDPKPDPSTGLGAGKSDKKSDPSTGLGAGKSDKKSDKKKKTPPPEDDDEDADDEDADDETNPDPEGGRLPPLPE